MEVIPQRTLRNDISEILRRVEAGESFVISVGGRPVAELTPVSRGTWVSPEAVAAIFETPGDESMLEVIRAFREGTELRDPWES